MQNAFYPRRLDGAQMNGRKYAEDYVLEDHVTATGKRSRHRVYQGPYFVFSQPHRELRRIGTRLYLLLGAELALLLPMLLDNTRLGRTVYIVLPVVLSMVPLVRLSLAARCLRAAPARLTRQQRDSLRGQLRGGVFLTVLLSVSCVGTWILAPEPAELLAAVCLHLALAAAAAVLLVCRRVSTYAE